MIPVYVNVFNRLTTTRRLCEQIAKLPGAEVVIVDNASTWEPLLDWYSDCGYEVIRLKQNLGHHAPWISSAVEQDQAPYYCVTDCDLDIESVPTDVLDILKEPLSWRGLEVVKSGLSLRIDDLPPWQAAVVQWEKQFWRKPWMGGKYYIALIDTTFAMYLRSTSQSVATSTAVTCVRSAPPYCARHLPWYLDCEHLNDEEKNYFTTASCSNSWTPHGKALITRKH